MTFGTIFSERSQKLGLTEQEYDDVVKAQREDYESDISADSDNDIDGFRILFDAATQKLHLPATIPSLPSAPVPTAFSRDNLNLVKQQWTDVYCDHGLEALAMALVKEEIDARLSQKNALISTDISWASQAMYDVLLTIDAELIKSIMNGNISLDKRQNTRLRAELAKIREQSKHQPSIYHQSLVDENGLSPTPNELNEMLGYMERYMKACALDKNPPETKDIQVPAFDRNTMCEIDSLKNFVRKKFDKVKFDKMHFAKYMWHVVYVPVSTSTAASTAASTFTSTSTTKGKGKAKAVTPNSSPASSDHDSDDSSSAKTKQKKKQQRGLKAPQWRYSKAHVIQTKAFVRALRERLASIDPADHDKPLQFPLVEVGYAKDSIQRLGAHKSHRNSNYIMNLMDALFTLYGPKIGKGQNKRPKYKIEQEVIALIWKVNQAEVSEIGLTKLAEGYIHNAGGFSHFPAGLSNDSAHRVRPKIWSAAHEWVMDHTCYRSNLQKVVDDLNVELVNKRLKMEDVRKQTRDFEETASACQATGMDAAQEMLRQLRDEGVATPESRAVEVSMKKIEKSMSSYRLDLNDIETKIQLCKQERDRVDHYRLLSHNLDQLAIISDNVKPTTVDDGEADTMEEELDDLFADVAAEVDEGEAGWHNLKDVIDGGEFDHIAHR